MGRNYHSVYPTALGQEQQTLKTPIKVKPPHYKQTIYILPTKKAAMGNENTTRLLLLVPSWHSEARQELFSGIILLKWVSQTSHKFHWHTMNLLPFPFRTVVEMNEPTMEIKWMIFKLKSLLSCNSLTINSRGDLNRESRRFQHLQNQIVSKMGGPDED